MHCLGPVNSFHFLFFSENFIFQETRENQYRFFHYFSVIIRQSKMSGNLVIQIPSRQESFDIYPKKFDLFQVKKLYLTIRAMLRFALAALGANQFF